MLQDLGLFFFTVPDVGLSDAVFRLSSWGVGLESWGNVWFEIDRLSMPSFDRANSRVKRVGHECFIVRALGLVATLWSVGGKAWHLGFEACRALKTDFYRAFMGGWV